MAYRALESSSIRGVDYDEQDRTLEVYFHSYGDFRYFDVPPFLYEGLVAAKSAGVFFNTKIRDRFRHEELGRSR